MVNFKVARRPRPTRPHIPNPNLYPWGAQGRQGHSRGSASCFVLSFFQNSSGRTTGQPRQTRPGSCTADRPSCTTMMTHFRASTFCRGFKCGGVFYQVKKYISAITSYTGTTRIPTGPETTYYVCMYNNTAAPAWTCTVLGTTRAIQAAGRNQPRIFISCFFCLFPFFCILKSFRRKLIYMQESLYFAT